VNPRNASSNVWRQAFSTVVNSTGVPLTAGSWSCFGVASPTSPARVGDPATLFISSAGPFSRSEIYL
jgi:hypothetical protein